MSAVRGAVSACRRRRLPDEKGIETLYNKTVDTYPPVEWRRRLPDEKGIETATRIVARRRCDMAAPRDHDPQTVRGIHPREAPSRYSGEDHDHRRTPGSPHPKPGTHRPHATGRRKARRRTR